MTAPEPLMPLLIAAKPGAKPREALIDEATAEQLLADVSARLTAIRAAKAAYAGIFAADTALDYCPDCGESALRCQCPSGEDATDSIIDDDTTAGELGAVEVDADDAPSGEGICMIAGCGHGAGDHVQSRGTGKRMFCVTCACRRYLGPLPDADAGDDAAIMACPGAGNAGPCSRLSGHEGPHRTLEGHEWGVVASEPDAATLPACARPGCGHPEQAHMADDGENADGPCLKWCDCDAYLLPPSAVLTAVAPVSLLRHDQQTLTGVRIGDAS